MTALTHDPRAWIDKNGNYQSDRVGVDKEAHDAWMASTTWNLSRDDFIRLSYFGGNMEDGSDGVAAINGSDNRPHDVVYKNETGGTLTRSMVSEWLTDFNAFTRGYKKRAQAVPAPEDRRFPSLRAAVVAFLGKNWTRVQHAETVLQFADHTPCGWRFDGPTITEKGEPFVRCGGDVLFSWSRADQLKGTVYLVLDSDVRERDMWGRASAFALRQPAPARLEERGQVMRLAYSI